MCVIHIVTDENIQILENIMLINSIYFGFTLRKKKCLLGVERYGHKTISTCFTILFFSLVLLFYYKSCMKLINLYEGSFDCSMGSKVQNV